MTLPRTIAVLIGLASPAFSQERLELPIIQSPFHRSWQPRDLGMPSHLPALHSVEGPTFDPQSGNLLLLLKPNQRAPELYSARPWRDARGRIVRFGQAWRVPVTFGGVDSGLEINGRTVFCPEYLGRNLHQVNLATAASQVTPMAPLGGGRPTAIGAVPTGIAGAGRLKLIDLGGSWFDVQLGPLGSNGIFPVRGLTKRATLSKAGYGVTFLAGGTAPFSPRYCPPYIM